MILKDLHEYMLTYYARNRERLKARRKEYYRANREAVLAQAKEYGERTREKKRAYDHVNWRENKSVLRARNRRNHLRKQYGLTPEQWTTMFLEQGRCCAVCKSPTPGGHGKWHTDHNHETNQVRGILCHNCNVALGLVKDKAEILEALVRYLRGGE